MPAVWRRACLWRERCPGCNKRALLVLGSVSLHELHEESKTSLFSYDTCRRRPSAHPVFFQMAAMTSTFAAGVRVAAAVRVSKVRSRKLAFGV